MARGRLHAQQRFCCFSKFVTRTFVPNGNVRCAAVSAFNQISHRSMSACHENHLHSKKQLLRASTESSWVLLNRLFSLRCRSMSHRMLLASFCKSWCRSTTDQQKSCRTAQSMNYPRLQQSMICLRRRLIHNLLNILWSSFFADQHSVSVTTTMTSSMPIRSYHFVACVNIITMRIFCDDCSTECIAFTDRLVLGRTLHPTKPTSLHPKSPFATKTFDAFFLTP